MNGNEVAIDTNWAVAILNGNKDFARRLKPFPVIRLPATVLGEVTYGALNSAQASVNLRRIEQLVRDCPLIPIEERVAQAYGEIRLSLKRKGKPIPDNDVWIAACCVAYDFPLATRDQHFLHVDRLQIVSMDD